MPTIEINDRSQLDPDKLENGPPYIMPLQLYLEYLAYRYQQPKFLIPYWFEYLCAEKNIVIKVTNCYISASYSAYQTHDVITLQQRIAEKLRNAEKEQNFFCIFALDMHTNVCLGFATAIINKTSRIFPTDHIYLSDLASAKASIKGWNDKWIFALVGSILMTSLSVICATCNFWFYLLAANNEAEFFFKKFAPYGLNTDKFGKYKSNVITPDTLIPPLSYYRDRGLVNYAQANIMPCGYNMQLHERRTPFLETLPVADAGIQHLTSRNKALFYAGNAFLKWRENTQNKKGRNRQ